MSCSARAKGPHPRSHRDGEEQKETNDKSREACPARAEAEGPPVELCAIVGVAAREKLLELHGVRVSKETLRKWMAEAGIWVTRAKRLPRAHQPRNRRPCFGELVQIDGSPHAWFEARGPECTLLVYVDDATGKVFLKNVC